MCVSLKKIFEVTLQKNLMHWNQLGQFTSFNTYFKVWPSNIIDLYICQNDLYFLECWYIDLFFSMIQNMHCLLSLNTKKRRDLLRHDLSDSTSPSCHCLKNQGLVMNNFIDHIFNRDKFFYECLIWSKFALIILPSGLIHGLIWILNCNQYWPSYAIRENCDITFIEVFNYFDRLLICALSMIKMFSFLKFMLSADKISLD